MRVNDLAKELGKTNKELLAFLNSRGADLKSHMSNISDEQAQSVRDFVKGKGTSESAKKEGPVPVKRSEAEKQEQRQAEKKAESTAVPTREQSAPAERSGQEKNTGDTGVSEDHQSEEPRKKKFTAVFRPQNAQQPRRPQRNAQNSQGRVFTTVEKENTSSRTAPAAPAQVKEKEPAREQPQNTVQPEVRSEKPQERVPEKKTAETKPQTAEKTSVQKASEPAAVKAPAAAQTVQTSDRSQEAKDQSAQKNVKNQNAERPQGDNSARKPETAASRTPAPAAQTAQNKPAEPEPVRKTPLVEGRRTVTTLGNVFANQTRKPASQTGDQNSSNNTRSQDNRGRDNNRGQSQNNRNQFQNRDGRNGDRPFNRDNRQGQGRQDRDQRPDRPQGQFNRDNRQVRTGGTGGFNRPDRRDGQGGPARGGQGGPARTGQGTGRPAGPGQGAGRPGQGAGRPSQAPAMDGAFAKKTTGNYGKNNKNNFKDKNDKRHRTEDGPVKGGRVNRHPFIKPEAAKVEVPEDDIKEIVIPEKINIRDLASAMKMQPAVIVKKLFLKGQIVNVNTELTFEQAEEIALEYDIICTMEEKVDIIAELLKEGEEDEDKLVPRPPVVCVMGHVDHGKTSLLDKIRQSNVTSREAGGITQAIGAYQVMIGGRNITFLDTPGHEAFTAMRMRGAQATDIAVLVIAADDGVMPQTVEAINHAKAAGVEIIVAVNKIDKPEANVERIKQEMTEYELVAEDWGGSTIYCPVSAKTGEGIENLLEMILLTADLKELQANPDRLARGIVIEAELDKGRGPVATVLVQKGTLNVGDFIAAGSCSGKVRAMINDKGQRVKTAGPSTPVEILGLDSVPNAGEVFVATETDKEAKDFAATFISERKNELIEETKAKMSLDDLFSQIKAGTVKELPIIVKADVQGSVEAVRTSLLKLSNEEVQVKVIHGGVGSISESDVALASASNAIIIGFNVKPDAVAKATAEHENVDIRLYRVIYQAIEDVENAMKGMLEPIYEEKVIGHAEIRQIFKASGVGSIAGSYILDGIFQRGCKARITRDGEQIFDGEVASLKRFKDDVREVRAGYECGLVFAGFNDIAEGDQIEGYTMVEVPRT